MLADNTIQKDYRAPIAIGALCLLALYFWLTSRYPALNEKALMGGDSPLSGLSFEMVYEILPNSTFWWEIFANTANWIKTNLKGMTFGVLFGAAALTVLATIKKRSFKSGFANSALGAAIGAPLGVCVNCAMPIALGLHMGRMRLETTLSALFASPTLNVIVITMSFALLPLHLAVLKLLFALVLVLIIVPLLCKFVLHREAAETGADMAAAMPGLAKVSEPKGLTGWFAKMLAPKEAEARNYNPPQAALWFVKTYARNLFAIALITVPLMFLAALLGAAIASVVSPTELVGALPKTSALTIVLVTLAIVAIASFVPAPIAFDVILTVILINVGLEEFFALAALIALGSFSVYPFLIIGKAISWRTAFALWGAVIGVAACAGAVAYFMTPAVERYYEDRQLQVLNAVDAVDWPTAPPPPAAQSTTEITAQIAQHELNAVQVEAGITSSKSGDIAISMMDGGLTAAADISEADGKPFARLMGTEIGLAEIGVNSPIRSFGYYMIGRAIAAGDVHGDGWTDIITPRPPLSTGLSIYANVGGKFVRQEAELGPVDDLEVFNVALADVDGDFALDLIVSTIMGGDYLFFNDNGSFSSAKMVVLKDGGHDVVAAYGFADMDRDGDLDVILGKWAPRGIAEGWSMRPYHVRNQIIWNKGDRKFETDYFEGIPGPTFAIVISDFNGDGFPDVLKGDDTGASDDVTYFGPDGPITATRENQPFEYFLTSTMSYDQGDWNNDLIPDYYGGQISMEAGMVSPSLSRTRNINAICMQYGEDFDWSEREISACFAELLSHDQIRGAGAAGRTDDCRRPATKQDRAMCGAATRFGKYANKDRDPDGDPVKYEQCRKELEHIPTLAKMCKSILEPTIGRLKRKELIRFFRPGLQSGNILQTGAQNGIFTDMGVEAGVRAPGWTWNARFTDLDQDGWQDLLAMTAMWLNTSSSHTNVFYHNTGNGFSNQTDQYGFTDVAPAFSYVSLDYDRDGDIDIVRDNSALRMIVHRNDKPAGPALWVNLRDNIGNSMGIGARVTICVDGQTTVAAGSCQMRYIKASGGFMSTNPIAAHFGLGKAKAVSLIEISWADGEQTSITPTSMLGGEITVTRK